jgi:hypothetical protein
VAAIWQSDNAPICRSALAERAQSGQSERVQRYEYVGPPLTRESAAALLEAKGVSSVWYSVNGAQVFDGIVLRQTPEGWAVFYTERGHDSAPTTHMSEASACQSLVELLLNDRGYYKPGRA